LNATINRFIKNCFLHLQTQIDRVVFGNAFIFCRLFVLLIWDIHINARHADDILQQIRLFVERHADQNHILFMWDYVYHFSYHRKSLLLLFAYFIELYQLWKHVYVLAWNHDRLGESFVFAEWQTALQIVQSLQENNWHLLGATWSLHLITTPRLTEIEGQKFLFLPFVLQTAGLWVADFDITQSDSAQDIGLFGSTKWWHTSLVEIVETAKQLALSEHKMERMSWYVNLCIAEYVKNNPDLMLVHHRYVAKTIFPWQKWQFGYTQWALHPWWLDMPWLRMIAGHIHQPFVLKNFLCTWSVWHTSPNEANHIKYLFVLDKNVVRTYPLFLSPYIVMQWQATALTSLDVTQMYDEVATTSQSVMQSNAQWTVEHIEPHARPDLSDVRIRVVTDVSYGQIETVVDESLRAQTKDIKLTAKKVHAEHLLEQLDISNKNLWSSLQDRKDLLFERLDQKYWDKAQGYKDLLQELQLI